MKTTGNVKETKGNANKLEVELRGQLLALLRGGQAHAAFDKAIHGVPAHLYGKVPEELSYSLWQSLEHLRIAQRDILDFSQNEDGRYKRCSGRKTTGHSLLHLLMQKPGSKAYRVQAGPGSSGGSGEGRRPDDAVSMG